MGIIDFFTLLINCLSSATSIHTMGFNATWDPNTINFAKWISIFTLLYVIVWPCVQTCCCLCSLAAGGALASRQLMQKMFRVRMPVRHLTSRSQLEGRMCTSYLSSH